ncbi:hypothetical protein VW35_16045 [Devosia soli]|uniref:diguanylate cyclase n=1 Tax=Devosia soli TaxID=361041 RepID=A0A0F5L443_9HYPH|nr:sensor domain-containing diguanylate cyclase [Devosia soli]KKB76995.1 hypothetical protein VW35_16045 [Devosia soli]
MAKSKFDFHLFRERFSLRSQLALVVGVLSVALALITALAAANVASQQATARAHQSLHAVASGLAERLDYRMFERYREIRNLASLAPLSGIWESDPDSVRAILGSLQSTYRDYAWIGLADLSGEVIASTGGLLEGKSVAERPWFLAGRTQSTVLDLHDAKLLAELLGKSPDGEPFRFVDVSVPVRNGEGRIVGVLGAHLSWAFAQSTRKSLLSQLPASRQTDIWILNSAGAVLSGPSFGSTPFGQTDFEALKAGASVEDAANGILASAAPTTGYLEYPGLGWVTVAVQPRAAALADANALTSTILQVGLVLASAGALAGIFAAGWILRPLTLLTNEIDKIGRDDRSMSVTRHTDSREMLLLSSALRSLLRRVGTAEHDREEAQKAVVETTSRMEEKTRRMGEDINTLRQMADTDPLTGLLNRRAFNTFAEDSLNHFRRYKRPIAFFVIDIDFFKRVNDDFGHAAGDEVIRAVGSLVSDAIRTTDKVARFGGEEFVVILREMDPAHATGLAERIRASISDAPIEHNGSPISVTVSIGVALVAQNDRDVNDTIERADRALYRAKTSGRNRVVADWSDDSVGQAAA